MELPEKLVETIQQNSLRPQSPAVDLLVREILDQYGEAVQAVLFYGSCFHKGEDLEGLFDLYVLVSRYDTVNRNSLQAVLNKLLPPNVFYLEVPFEGQKVRAKYAILTIGDLQKGTSRQWFHSYLWARFCQPTAMVYVRNAKVTEQVSEAFAQAVITFIYRVLPRISEQFTIRELWGKGLELTYRSEFRPEQADRQVRLFDAQPEYFSDITRKALEGSPYRVNKNNDNGNVIYDAVIPDSVRFVSCITWFIRMVQGKVLSALRLAKGSFTFDGGVDYILWKIKRHSGVSLEVSPFLKRHPVLAMFVLFYRLYRLGGVK